MLPVMNDCGHVRANAPMNAYLNRLVEIEPPARGHWLAPFDRILRKGLLQESGAITLKYFYKSNGSP